MRVLTRVGFTGKPNSTLYMRYSCKMWRGSKRLEIALTFKSLWTTRFNIAQWVTLSHVRILLSTMGFLLALFARRICTIVSHRPKRHDRRLRRYNLSHPKFHARRPRRYK